MVMRFFDLKGDGKLDFDELATRIAHKQNEYESEAMSQYECVILSLSPLCFAHELARVPSSRFVWSLLLATTIDHL